MAQAVADNIPMLLDGAGVGDWGNLQPNLDSAAAGKFGSTSVGQLFWDECRLL